MAVEAGSSVFASKMEEDEDLNSFDSFALPDLPDPEPFSYSAADPITGPLAAASVQLPDPYGFHAEEPVQRRRSSQPSVPSPAPFSYPEHGFTSTVPGPTTPLTPAGDGYGFVSATAANFGGMTPGAVSAVKPRRLSLGNHPVIAYVRPTTATATASTAAAAVAPDVATATPSAASAVPVSKPSYNHNIRDPMNASLSSLKQSATNTSITGGGTTARKAVVSSGYGMTTTSSTPSATARASIHKPSAIPGAGTAVAAARPVAASGSLSSRGSMLPSLSSRTAGTYAPSFTPVAAAAPLAFSATYTPIAAPAPRFSATYTPVPAAAAAVAAPANFNAYTPVAAAAAPPNFNAFTPVAAPAAAPNFNAYTPVPALAPPAFNASYTPPPAAAAAAPPLSFNAYTPAANMPPPTSQTPPSPTTDAAAAPTTAEARPTVTTPTLFGGSTMSRVTSVQAQHAPAPTAYDAQQFAPWGTPQTMMAANMPLGDESPYFGQSDMDTMDFAGEAQKVLMALGGGRNPSMTPPPRSMMAGMAEHLTPGVWG